MKTESMTTDNSIDPNTQTMPVDLVIVDESIVMDDSLATESVNLPATSESIVINDLNAGIFPSSVPAADSLAQPLGTRIGVDDKLKTESAANWESLQAEIATSLENAKSFTTAFFKNNQQLLKMLGIIFLAIISVKVLVAGLSAIDGIPLFTPLLKAIGLVYVVRFVWRYLIREHDRQELVETLNRTKTEVFGGQN